MKVQSYRTLARFIQKTENFLLGNEVVNNLFWETLSGLVKVPSSSVWAGVIIENGEIKLCAIRTEANYLLISSGKNIYLEHLMQYFKRKKWKLKGVSGPRQGSLFFTKIWLKGISEQVEGRRDFGIYESPKKISQWRNDSTKQYSIKAVGNNEWPRARLWAFNFACESNPPLNGSALVLMAKKMMKNQSLFFIQSANFETCGMAGFGRETPSYFVINLVYVPVEWRNQKIAQKLILDLVHFTQQEKKKKCILFSDYQEGGNLYQSIGFKMVSKYAERMF
ncbi:GNAT family N-acetyltransferase [Opitutales bacterium]|nr:GNAT family N-acetyltransferase [Opitutales bacterium]